MSRAENRKVLRQGDVLLIPIRAVPKDARLVLKGEAHSRIVLATGEATGHAHAVLVKDLDLELLERGDERFLTVGGGATELVHEEHSAIGVAPGAYKVVRQGEYLGEDEYQQVRD